MIPEQFEVFAQELDQMRTKHFHNEADRRYLADPPGKEMMEVYARRFASSATDLPVFYAPLPPPSPQRRAYTLAPLLLAALGDPAAYKREGNYSKSLRLSRLFHERQVRLCLLADFHHLMAPSGHIDANEVNWFKWLWHNEMTHLPVVVTGKIETVEILIRSHDQLDALFWPIHLPLSVEETGQQQG